MRQRADSSFSYLVFYRFVIMFVSLQLITSNVGVSVHSRTKWLGFEISPPPLRGLLDPRNHQLCFSAFKLLTMAKRVSIFFLHD